MSKYSNYEMCEKILGQRYKCNEQNQDYELYSRTDMWNKLIEQQDKIADLESKLVENEDKILELQEQSIRDNQNWIEETTQLKQQLHDLPKKIVGEIKKELYDCGKTYLEDEPYIEICIVQGILDTILKKYGGKE